MLSRLRMQYVTAAFLAEMRRQFVLLHPGADSPVRDLADYPAAERSALMTALAKAIELAGAEGDASYRDWLERQSGKFH